jgi:peptide chain release factor 3
MGMGKGLVGLYDRVDQQVELYRENEAGDRFLPLDAEGKLAPSEPLVNESIYRDTLDDIELLNDAGNQYDLKKIMAGDQTPVFFGSALTNFGVETFLKHFVDMAPAPGPHKLQDGSELSPTANDFSGFVFKIQANMNPQHRDRIAFVRIGAGEFDRGMDVTLARTGKTLRLNNATEFMSDSREAVQTAVAGDIVGLYDTGNFQIGDTIYAGKQKLEYEALPQFTPELFMRVTAKNVMKQKSFHKGMQQLVQEGAVQLYKTYTTGDYILGAVGQLQFEVFKFRMLNEYNSEVVMSPIGSRVARWIDPDQLDEKMSSSRNLLVKDIHDEPLFLFENQYAERWFADKYPDVHLTAKL